MRDPYVSKPPHLWISAEGLLGGKKIVRRGVQDIRGGLRAGGVKGTTRGGPIT